ncbi:TIGR01459 family HAD-type hydrolase [Magnetofaba australis]|nr:TIGR01459 family HAD-type hydrolase [Magnetofaba australis]
MNQLPTAKPHISSAAQLAPYVGRYRAMLTGVDASLEARLNQPKARAPEPFGHIVAEYDAVLLDAYGVLTHGVQAIPGAPQRVSALRRAGKQVRVLSNNANQAPTTVLAGLRRQGFDFTAEELITSGMAVRPFLQQSAHQQQTQLWIGIEEGRTAYAPAAIDSAEGAASVLMCSDKSFFGGPQQQQAEALLARAPQAPILLANPDLVVVTVEGGFYPVSGYTAALLSEAYGAPLVGIGKPFAPAFDLALSTLRGVARNRVLMVGDSLETDILGARAAGIDCCLTLSGVAGLIARTLPGGWAELCDQRSVWPDHVTPDIGADAAA